MWWNLTVAIILSAFPAQAQSPTVIEAVANTPDGKKNISIVEQPAGAPNPLGNPIVGPDIAPQAYNSADALQRQNSPADISASAGQSYQAENNTYQTEGAWYQAKELGKEFSNTLSEEGGQIYDVQTFPAQDIKLITDPSNPQIIYSPNAD